jgi:aminopeptidase N
MKKTTVLFMAAIFMLATFPLQSRAADEIESVAVETVESNEDAKAEAIMERLAEIEEMDKSEMSASEKKEVRKEVRSLKKDLKELGSGVYLSAGALILVIVLLILLL